MWGPPPPALQLNAHCIGGFIHKQGYEFIHCNRGPEEQVIRVARKFIHQHEPRKKTTGCVNDRLHLGTHPHTYIYGLLSTSDADAFVTIRIRSCIIRRLSRKTNILNKNQRVWALYPIPNAMITSNDEIPKESRWSVCPSDFRLILRVSQEVHTCMFCFLFVLGRV